MKKKTLNAQHSLLNIEWLGVREDVGVYVAKSATSNAKSKDRQRFDLVDRLLEFSARIIRLVDAMPNTRAANHLPGQLLRCGTSPHGNHGEVEAAESRKDFIHKLKVRLKELKETVAGYGWLRNRQCCQHQK